ncbi:MAG: hypothetical protein V1709_08285 [Planctomycetota bacterium]
MMKRNYLYRLMEAFMLITVAYSCIVCFAFEGEFSPKRLDRIHEEDKRWSDWIKRYIKDVLYVGMSEDEFVGLFTRDASWIDSERPYIISHKGNEYIFVGRKKIRYKVTFKDGILARLGQRTWEKIPILTTHYADFTFLLKGHKYTDGLYKGMAEDEFLKNFFHKVVSKFKRGNENGYILLLKHGNKLEVCFEDKTLVDVSWYDKHTYGTIDELM